MIGRQKSWLDQMMLLPAPALRAWVKIMNVLPLFLPTKHCPDNVKDILKENKCTKEEWDSFHECFPNGFFGDIKLPRRKRK